MLEDLLRSAVIASGLALSGIVPAHAALTLENLPSPVGPGCRQVVIGVTTDAARVRPLVPRQFIFSRDGAGKAQLGYRVQTCDRLSIDGEAPRRASWSELGVRILPPEGLPELHADPHVDGHDYYVLAVHTTDRVLAAGLRAVGVRPMAARRLLARETWMELERAPSPLPAGSLAADLTAGGTLGTGERTSRGAITVSGDMLGGMIARTTPVVHVHHWFVDGRCRLIRGEETRTRTVGGLAAFRLRAGSGTLLAALAAPAGGAVDTQGTDTVVVADTTATWQRATAEPQPAASAAYEALRPRSQGSPDGCP